MGLSGAGKTTIMYKLKLGEVVTTMSTIGFNVETIDYKHVSFTCWDIGGGDKVRPLLRHYFPDTKVCVWVVDSNDKDRVIEVADELHRCMADVELRDSSLLVWANKQDLPNSMSVAEITECLELHQLRNRSWHIQAVCATCGDGLYEGLDWMCDEVRRRGL